MEKINTVVVKNRPKTAVTVNKDKFILNLCLSVYFIEIHVVLENTFIRKLFY